MSLSKTEKNDDSEDLLANPLADIKPTKQSPKPSTTPVNYMMTFTVCFTLAVVGGVYIFKSK